MLIGWRAPGETGSSYPRYGHIRAYQSQKTGLSDKFTDDFIAAATSNLRCARGMVEVTWAASAVDDSRVGLTNDINRIDRKGQLFNNVTTSGEKWAYLHPALIADGSFHPMPELDTEAQMGWYGTTPGDGSGNFAVTPYMEVSHLARSYTALLIAGDSVYSEYPVDFTVTFTHAGGPTVMTITGNTSRIYSISFAAIPDVTKITLAITKWSVASTIIKITQFSGSLIEFYRAGDIVELNILEETNSDTGVVPIGNVSSNELDLSLLNTDRRFSYGNTSSPYVSSLRSGRKVRVWLGFILRTGTTDATGDVPGYIVETEGTKKIGYMPYGVYWSKDWISSHLSQVTTTTAYDIAYRLSQRDFLKSLNYTGTVQAVINQILTEAKGDLPELDWTVSADTASETLNNVAFEVGNYLEILKDLATATLSYTFVNRFGVLVIGSRLKAATPLASWEKLDLSDYYDFESQPKIEELVNQVRVGHTEYAVSTLGSEIYSDDTEQTIPAGGSLALTLLWKEAIYDLSSVAITIFTVSGNCILTSQVVTAAKADIVVTGTAGDRFTVSATATTYADIYSADDILTIAADGRLSLFIKWSKSPIITASALVNVTVFAGSPVLAALDVYAYGAYVLVTGNPGDTFRLSALGVPYDLTEITQTQAQDSTSITIYGIRDFALTGNQLIATPAQALTIAEALLLLYGEVRQDAEINWPATTLFAVGDTLEIVEFKSDTVETKANFIIKRQTTTYDGAMQGSAELRRG